MLFRRAFSSTSGLAFTLVLGDASSGAGSVAFGFRRILAPHDSHSISSVNFASYNLMTFWHEGHVIFIFPPKRRSSTNRENAEGNVGRRGPEINSDSCGTVLSDRARAWTSFYLGSRECEKFPNLGNVHATAARFGFCVFINSFRVDTNPKPQTTNPKDQSSIANSLASMFSRISMSLQSIDMNFLPSCLTDSFTAIITPLNFL